MMRSSRRNSRKVVEGTKQGGRNLPTPISSSGSNILSTGSQLTAIPTAAAPSPVHRHCLLQPCSTQLSHQWSCQAARTKQCIHHVDQEGLCLWLICSIANPEYESVAGCVDNVPAEGHRPITRYQGGKCWSVGDEHKTQRLKQQARKIESSASYNQARSL